MKLIIMVMFLAGHRVHIQTHTRDAGILRKFIPESDVYSPQRTADALPIACKCLIQRLAWKNVIMVFDTFGELVVQDMFMYWSETQFQIPVQMTNVDSVDSSSNYRVLLDDLYHSIPHLNFLLVAQFKTVSAFIKQVNDFDLLSNRTTDFRHRSKWIIVSEASIKQNLTTWAKDLENVVLVSPFDVNGVKALKIFTIVRSFPGPSLTPVRCLCCNLITDDIFPNIKYKYNGKQLVVIRGHDDPFSLPKLRNGTITYEGYGIDILDAMANQMNFTYIITQPKDNNWGLLVNGTWNGLVGMLFRREADVQISSLTIHEDRSTVMHFLQPPIYTQVIDVLYKRDDLYEDKLFTYIRPFKPMVFLCIGVSATVVCVLFVISEYISEHSTKRSVTSGSYRRVLLLVNNVGMFIVASTAQRSTSIKTRTSSGSILVASWRLFLIVTTAAYTANLIAELTSQKPRVPFKTLGELVDNKDFTFGLTSNGINRLIFEKTKHGDIKRAWTAIQHRASTDPTILRESDEYHLRRALGGRYAWITSRKTGSARRRGNCSLVYMNSPFNWQHVAFGVPIGSSYIDDFEKTLSILNDNGILAHLRTKWFKTPCDNKEHTSFESTRTLELSDVRAAFILSAAGIGLAIIVMVLEIVYTRARSSWTEDTNFNMLPNSIEVANCEEIVL